MPLNDQVNDNEHVGDEEKFFTCRICGECCKGFGGTYVSESDIRAISDYKNIDPGLFKNKYCQKSGSRFVIAQSESGYCVFWDKICTIHSVKPGMCRAWPFIGSILVDSANWKIMAGSCPGINTEINIQDLQNYIRERE